ncbi:TrkH-domain-containing protein [Punctularia strigosozonata HHB-11173 SS5]|uniref:TrkH-domain-containing protein n=1 Tax=Punctularia strigosozonata (strain HHB-11173) TaxID=741275 RepID=UPI0004417B7A|nr:TrkH-domain-containing protein [Punctularia strigosozonata HHB-11173 SS5]EIN06562.1 TrkH-domain-containing protein [Punctularia strigosozonata HHB-11173 SS5]
MHMDESQSPSLDSDDPPNRSYTAWTRIRERIAASLNFYRVHTLIFTFVPLIWSGIFYASNGSTHIAYIDALFNSVSAFCVCGLTTVDLSALTPWQQVILFIQMNTGSTTFVSFWMVYVRRHYFAQAFRERVRQVQLAKRNDPESAPLENWRTRITRTFTRSAHPETRPAQDAYVLQEKQSPATPLKKRKKGGVLKHVKPDMIRRTTDRPMLINPSGWISEGGPGPDAKPMPSAEAGVPSASTTAETGESETPVTFLDVVKVDNADPGPSSASSSSSTSESTAEDGATSPMQALEKRSRRLSEPGSSPQISAIPMNRSRTFAPTQEVDTQIARTATVDFALPRAIRDTTNNNGEGINDRGRPTRRNSILREPTITGSVFPDRTSPSTEPHEGRRSRSESHMRPGPAMRTHTMHTIHTVQSHARSFVHDTFYESQHHGFGGWPMPHKLLLNGLHKLFPGLQEKMHRTLTVPLTTTYTRHAYGHPGEHDGRPLPTGVKLAPYFSFDAFAGRNSAFPYLTHEQLEEVGGVEYQALCLLLWLVGGLWFGSQMLAFVIIAPYISQPRWKSAFEPPNLHKHVPPPWFALFQVVSSYTNTGMSLVDQSMIPFQKAYPMIFLQAFLILCGNTSFPLFLRLLIWTLTKILPSTSDLHGPLRFLLDHPRRCYLYLFPSHQTWFLLLMVVVLNSTDWFFFMVLDIGNPAIDSIKLGTRFVLGLFQAFAVRAAGFATVTISNLAPAVKVLYVIMMYVSIYPIAMSVRSTNVYEERSLGVFIDEDEEEERNQELEQNIAAQPGRVAVWGKYLVSHARKQLSFDMWWLGFALFLVCIIERKPLDETEKASWFNIFYILFELVSAYGGVGLSLGLPNANYSFSGALSPLSKLVVCAVIIRGRHRGLPQAIDRAVVFPYELRVLRDRENQDGATITAVPTSNASGVNLRPQRTRTTSFGQAQSSQDTANHNVFFPRTRTRASQLPQVPEHV